MYRDDPYCAENVPSLVLWYITNASSSAGPLELVSGMHQLAVSSIT